MFIISLLKSLSFSLFSFLRPETRNCNGAENNVTMEPDQSLKWVKNVFDKTRKTTIMQYYHCFIAKITKCSSVNVTAAESLL